MRKNLRAVLLRILQTKMSHFWISLFKLIDSGTKMSGMCQKIHNRQMRSSDSVLYVLVFVTWIHSMTNFRSIPKNEIPAGGIKEGIQ